MKSMLKKIFVNNWYLKLFSVAVAFILWIIVRGIDDPEGRKVFRDVPVTLLNSESITDKKMVYSVIDGSDSIATVTVTAPLSVRNEMTASDIVATADLANAGSIDTVDISVTVPKYDDKIADIKTSSKVLKLDIEQVRDKYVSIEVRTKGEVADGCILWGTNLDQNRIQVSGPESEIIKVASAAVSMDVTDARSDISDSAVVYLYDINGYSVRSDDIVQNTKSVRVTAYIMPVKTVPIVIGGVSGEPAQGYRLSGVSDCDTAEVEIAAKQSKLDRTSSIEIPPEALDVTDLDSDLVIGLGLEDFLPDGVYLADSDYDGHIQVTVGIEEDPDAQVPEEELTEEEMQDVE